MWTKKVIFTNLFQIRFTVHFWPIVIMTMGIHDLSIEWVSLKFVWLISKRQFWEERLQSQWIFYRQIHWSIGIHSRFGVEEETPKSFIWHSRSLLPSFCFLFFAFSICFSLSLFSSILFGFFYVCLCFTGECTKESEGVLWHWSKESGKTVR